jgi:hypothetical protein
LNFQNIPEVLDVVNFIAGNGKLLFLNVMMVAVRQDRRSKDFTSPCGVKELLGHGRINFSSKTVMS